MENNQNSNNNQQIKKKWYETKKAKIGFCALLGASMLTAILAPTLVAVTKRSVSTITVTFDPNGGTMTSTTQEVKNGELCTEPAATKTGYVIDCWKNGNTIWNFATDKVTTPITLTAQWKTSPTPTTTYTVNFDVAGGTFVPSQEVPANGLVSNPSVSKVGYTLDGWYYTSSAGTQAKKWDFTTDTVTSNIILVAKWTAVSPTPTSTVTITFNSGNLGHFASSETQFQLQVAENIVFANISGIPSVVPNDGYISSGWLLDGQLISNDLVIGQDITLVANYIPVTTKINLTLKFGSASGVTGKFANGNTSTVIELEKGKTYAQLKNSLPTLTTDDETYVLDGWKATDTMEESGAEPAEITDGTIFNESTTIYPRFSQTGVVTHQVSLEVVLKDGQSITEGNKIVTKTYDEGTTVTFGELNKPTIACTDTSLVFEGWYKDENCTEEWENDDSVDDETTTPIYANFTTPSSECEVLFKTDPDIEISETYNPTWIGNQSVICNGSSNSVYFSNIAKPMVFNVIQGSPESGFSSIWYQSGWYYKEDGENIDINESTMQISRSITVYPKFTQKHLAEFDYKDTSGTTHSDKIALNPTGSWKDIKTPSDVAWKNPDSQDDEYFVGWKYTIQEEGETLTKVLTPESDLADIIADLKKTTTSNVLPNYISDVNTIEFSTDAHVKGQSLTTTISIDYEGPVKVGTDKNTAVNFLSGVNKPVVKQAADYEFVGWEIDKSTTTEPDWQQVDSDTVIEAATGEATTTKIRPIVESKFTLEFVAGDHGTLQPWSGTSVISTINTTSSTYFKDIYKPDVKAESGYKFKHWSLEDSTTAPSLQPSSTISAPETEENVKVYAIYEEDSASSTISFQIKPEDLATKDDFPVTISGTTVSKSRKFGEDNDLKFSVFAHGVATKYLYEFKGWQRLVDDEYVDMTGDELIPANDASNPYVVYAKFDKEADAYKKITVDDTDPTYEVVSTTNKVFVLKNGTFPVDLATSELDIKVERVGYEVCGWEDADGNILYDETEQTTPATVTDNLLNIKPRWKAATRQVTFTTNGDTQIQNMPTSSTVEGPYCTNLLDLINAQHYSPTRGTDAFRCWKVKFPGEEERQVTEEDQLTANCEVFPTFTGKSEYEYSESAYFYDEERASWAKIDKFAGTTEGGDSLQVSYPDQTIRYLPKRTFNYEVHIGKNMKEIPDNFMQGCTNWTNADQPLSWGDNTIYKIGKNFLEGCISFNQEVKLNFVQPTSTYKTEIGANFMRDCYAFNSNITISRQNYTQTTKDYENNYIYIHSGFMFSCDNFQQTLKFDDCWIRNYDSSDPDFESGTSKLFTEEWYSILSTNNKLCPMVQNGFKVALDFGYPNKWLEDEGETAGEDAVKNTLLPNLLSTSASGYCRNITWTQL